MQIMTKMTWVNKAILHKNILKKLFIFMTIIPLVSNGQNYSKYLPPEFSDKNRLAKIQKAFPVISKMYEKYAKENHFPGYVFGIMVDGKLVFVGNNGYADIKNKIQANAQTMFRIASITKSFTAMAILKLRDEGKLRLDDPVYLYIPEIKDQKLTHDAPEITIRDLLTHSAGFPEDNDWGDRNLDKNNDDLLAIIKKGISYSHVPGITYEYSNLAFAILGNIINKVSGTSCQNYITQNILMPLNMKQSSWEYSEIPNAKLAHGYKWFNNTWEEEGLLHDGSFGPMGGLITSIEAFSHYVALHQLAWPPRDDKETGIIKRSSIREMHQPWRFNEFDKSPRYLNRGCAIISAYGYGLRWLKDCDEKIYIGHGGGLPGFGSNWFIMPDYGIGVILFANMTYASASEINLRVLNTLVKKAQLKPRQLPPSKILIKRKNELIRYLPTWDGAVQSNIFAENFFLDSPLHLLKSKTIAIFKKVGKIIHSSEVIPENQLRGFFIMEGQKYNIKVKFTLTPESPALIQKVQIEKIGKNNNTENSSKVKNN